MRETLTGMHELSDLHFKGLTETADSATAVRAAAELQECAADRRAKANLRGANRKDCAASTSLTNFGSARASDLSLHKPQLSIEDVG